MSGRGRIYGGLSVLAAVAVLGLAARTPAVTRVDVGLDQRIAELRDPGLTAVAKAATIAAQAAVGAAIGVLVPAVLWLCRRRRDALLACGVMIGALGIAFVAKTLVAEHRPPERLWVIPPDNKMSFPSGHATVAAAVAVLSALLVRGRLRPVAVAAGALFGLVVAAARVYLGVHYPADVLGGYLAAAAAAFLVTGVLDLPAVRSALQDAGTPVTGRHHAGRHASDAAAGEEREPRAGTRVR